MPVRPDTLPFDLRALEIFLAVCDAGSMAAAARVLALTQPAVSQAIGDLETRIGVTLFDRSVRPLALTPAGGIMRQRAAALLSEARQIGPLLSDAAQGGRLALIRVGLVDSLVRALSTPIATYLASRADQVSILTGLTAAHAGALLTRNLDVFIGVDDMVDIAGLERFELITEPYILLLPPDTSRADRSRSLAALGKRLPFLRYSARSKTGMDVERHLRRMDLDLGPGPEFDTPFSLTEMVAHGRGFAISTPLCLVEAGLAKDAVVAVPLPGPQLQRTLTLVARRQELGSIPRDLARASGRALKAAVVPRINKLAPWLTDRLSVKALSKSDARSLPRS